MNNNVVGARVDAVNKVVGVEIPYVLDVAVVGTGVVCFVEILVVVLLGVVVSFSSILFNKGWNIVCYGYYTHYLTTLYTKGSNVLAKATHTV